MSMSGQNLIETGSQKLELTSASSVLKQNEKSSVENCANSNEPEQCILAKILTQNNSSITLKKVDTTRKNLESVPNTSGHDDFSSDKNKRQKKNPTEKIIEDVPKSSGNHGSTKSKVQKINQTEKKSKSLPKSSGNHGSTKPKLQRIKQTEKKSKNISKKKVQNEINFNTSVLKKDVNCRPKTKFERLCEMNAIEVKSQGNILDADKSKETKSEDYVEASMLQPSTSQSTPTNTNANMFEQMNANFGKENENSAEYNFFENIKNLKLGESILPPSEFQKYVIVALTKMNYDIMTLCNTTYSIQMTLETLMKNNSIAISKKYVDYNSLNFSDILPIKTEEELINFEQQIKENGPFRFKFINRFTMLFRNKNVRTCIQYIFNHVFEDEVLLNYTVKSNLKLKDFCRLEIYNVFRSILRNHQSFKSDADMKRGFELWMQQSNIRAMAKRSGVSFV